MEACAIGSVAGLGVFADGFVGPCDVPLVQTVQLSGLLFAVVFVDPPFPGGVVPGVDAATPDTLPTRRRIQRHLSHAPAKGLGLLKEHTNARLRFSLTTTDSN